MEFAQTCQYIYFLLFRTLQDIHGPKDEDHMNVDFVLLVWLPSRHEFNGTFNHGKRRNLSRKLSKLRVQRDSKFTPNSLWWRGAVHMSNRTVLIPSFINLYGCLYIYIYIYTHDFSVSTGPTIHGEMCVISRYRGWLSGGGAVCGVLSY